MQMKWRCCTLPLLMGIFIFLGNGFFLSISSSTFDSALPLKQPSRFVCNMWPQRRTNYQTDRRLVRVRRLDATINTVHPSMWLEQGRQNVAIATFVCSFLKYCRSVNKAERCSQKILLSIIRFQWRWFYWDKLYASPAQKSVYRADQN